MRTYIFLIFAVTICYAGSLPAATGQPVAVRGVIDLRNSGLGHGMIVPLNGEWEFYWKRLITPDEFSTPVRPESDGYFNVPGTWNRITLKDQTLGSNGFATFRLTVLMDANDGQYGIKPFRFASAFRLWANGALIASAGKVGTDKASSIPQYLPQVVPLVPANGRVDLVLQVSNYHHTSGGPWEEIRVGNEDVLRSGFMRKLLIEMFIAGSIFVMGLYHVVLFLFRRRDGASLYFGLFCFTISIWAVLNGEMSLVQAFRGLNWVAHRTVNYLALSLCMPFFFNYIRALFPRTPGWAVQVSNICAAVYALIILIAPIRIFSAILPFYEIVILAAIAIVLFVVIRELFNKNREAIFVCAGIIIYFATVVNDILYNNYIIYTIMLGHLGLFAFLLSQSTLMALRFSRAFQTAEKLSEDLQKKNESLRQLDILKDEFLANTSHELRTPLNGIIGIAESLTGGAAGPVSGEVCRNLDLVIASGRRLSNLVNDILDFSRLKHHDIQLNLSAVDIHSVAQAVLEMARYMGGGNSVTLINGIDPGLPPVIADEARIEQILHNLIGNSVKFTESGRILLGSRINGTVLEVNVSDTGTGISPEKLPRIFEPFEQADGSLTRTHGGTGLGLSITKKLVELHGGSITIDSRPGEGTTVLFTLPISGPPDHPAVKVSAAVESPDGTLHQEGFVHKVPETAGQDVSDRSTDVKAPESDIHILAADDDPVNLQVIKNTLSLSGYSVTAVTGGAEALREFEEGSGFDLVILDIMMPRISGFDVAKALRKTHNLSELPIIMLTAKNRIMDIVAGFQSGASDYIPKPFHREELLARVGTLIALKRAVRDNARLAVIESEITNALAIQRSILPDRPPVIPGIEVAFSYTPMRSLGGDYFDFFIMDRNRLGMFIADVSGHGLPAALIAAMIKIAFHFEFRNAEQPALLLDNMNNVLRGKFSRQFVTACYACIDPAGRTLSMASAGHPPLIIWRRSEGRLIEIKPHGRIIGSSFETSCKTESIPIIRGDRIILYTDGIIELRNQDGMMFDTRFYDAIEECAGLSASDFIGRLTERITGWCGNDDFDDDITIVVADIL
jgi:two-component system sensor histidine kinase ChiS